jgi:predicted metal-binding membrane protein
MPEFCLGGLTGDLPGAAAVASAAAFNPPGALAAGWGLMLVAMMPPLLIAPMTYIWDRSLARRRGRSLALFVGGYALAWLPVGIGLAELAVAARAAFGGAAIPLAAAVLAASAWQASPWKQACLNRCHRLPRLSAFGLAADRDALRFGVTHGFWCAGSCAAAMAVPLFLPFGHLPAMVALAACLFSERLEPARPCRWELRLPTIGPSLAFVIIRRAATGATS